MAALKSVAEQRIICFNHGKGNKVDEVDGIKVTRVNCIAKVSSQSISLSLKKYLKREMKEFKPDKVLFHFPNPFLAHYLLKQLKKYPECGLYVFWHLDITKQKVLGKLFNGQTIRLLERAKEVVATSPNYAEYSKYLQKFKDKCRVIPLCVSSQRVTYGQTEELAAQKIREQNEGKTILFAVGRHVPYKGMEYLIRASRLLDDNYRVFIGGKGDLTDSLKKLAAGDDKVQFIGAVDDSTLKAYFLACDIYCFPSITRNEAYGLALAEAMSFGKPAVTFTIEGSGVNFVSLDGVTGTEVENGNVEKYAEAIKELAGDGALREKYGKAARERAEEVFSEDKFREKILKLFTEDRQF